MPDILEWQGQKLDVDATLRELDRMQCEENLYDFLQHAWRFIDPAAFRPGWVLEALSEHLEAIVDGDLRRLIINIPPRCSKSTLCTVAFPAWVWAQPYRSPTSGPGVPILTASYAYNLCLRDSVRCRRLIKSPWYQRLWGDRYQILPDQDQKTRFKNTEGGERLITSVDAGVTGEGGNLIIVDDPNNAREILSDAVIQATNEEWWDGAMSTRLNDAKTGAIIVIQQRLGERDLTGHILANDKRADWTHLCFDAETEVLTTAGWIPFPVLPPDLPVLAVDPATLQARWERPTQHIVREYEGPMIAYKSATADLLVTPDHRIVYADVNDFVKGKSPRWRVRPAKDMPKHFYLPQTVQWENTGERNIRLGDRDWHPQAYAEFMGWYLSEGCANARWRNTRIVQKETGPHVQELARVMAATPFHAQRSRRPNGMICWEIKDRFLSAELAALGKSHTKRAPLALKNLPPELLQAFLMSYARGDGHFAVRNPRKITISSVSRQMIDDLQECAVKAGWAASLDVKEQPGGHVLNGYTLPATVVYRLYIRASKVPGVIGKIASKIRKENISRVDYRGNVYCLSVPSTAFVVRRRGRVTISGNCLPMEYEPERSFVTSIGWQDPRKEAGELLWPERFGPTEVRDLKERLKEWGAAGQLQQRPMPKGGGIIKYDWWKTWPPEGEEFDKNGDPVKPAAFPPCDFVLASLDTAYTENTMNDPSALTIWGVFSGDVVAQDVKVDEELTTRIYAETSMRVVLLYAWTGHLELNPLVNHIAKTCGRKGFKVDRLLVEDKAAGHSVVQEIRRLFSSEGFGVQLINPRKMRNNNGESDKLARLFSVSHLFEEGMIYAPDRKWSTQVMDQCAAFPNGTHDDLVDTVSMALRWLRDNGLLQRGPEITGEVVEDMLHKPKQGKLYPTT